MARAAAKKRPPARCHDTGRKHKDSSGQRYEDTLFFNRLRTHAKWVFVLLIIVFGLGFVLLGVGSSGSASATSSAASAAAAATAPRSASRWMPRPRTRRTPRPEGSGHRLRGEVRLRGGGVGLAAVQPAAAEGRRRTDPLRAGSHAAAPGPGNEARASSSPHSSTQPSTFGPPATSPLGRALGSLSDPIGQAAGSSALTAFQNALAAYQQTSTQLVSAYKKLVKLQPTDPSVRIQLAQPAEAAGDYATAIAAYRQLIRLAPDDPSVPQAKAKIKELEQQLAGSSATTQG